MNNNCHQLENNYHSHRPRVADIKFRSNVLSIIYNNSNNNNNSHHEKNNYDGKENKTKISI